MRTIYSQDVFLDSATAVEISRALLSFVQSYLFQAHKAFYRGVNFFPLIPKLHWVHEVSHELKRQALKAPFTVNPAVHSCSLDEDFIGRVAVVGRSVSPRLVPQRVMERYLAHIQLTWSRE